MDSTRQNEVSGIDLDLLAAARKYRIYDTALSANEDFIYAFDLAGRFIFANKALCDLLQRSSEEMVGKTFFDLLYPPVLATTLHQQIREVIETRARLRAQTPFTSADGQARVYEYIFSPVIGIDGEVEAVAGTTRDITQQYQARLQLDAANRALATQAVTLEADNAALQAMFEQAPGFMCVMNGASHVISLTNAAYRKLVGNERRLLGLSVKNALPELEGQGYFEWLDQVYASGQAVVRKGAPINMRQREDIPLTSMFVDFVYQPLFDETGEVAGIFCQGHDVTEQYMAYRQLQLSEEHFRLVAETIPQFIWGAKAHGSFDYYNPPFLAYLGLVSSASQSFNWAETMHPDDRASTLEKWAAAVDGGNVFSKELRVRRHADGLYRWFKAEGYPVRDDAGKVVRWFGIFTDLHDMREAARRKDEFLATLAHELRNPLAPISTAVRILMSDQASPAAIARSSLIIERQTRHMAILLDDLLDISRISVGRLELKKDYVTLESVLNAALETARPNLDARLHRVSVEMPEPGVMLEVDPVRMAQVLANLLNNAAKYTDPRGEVTLSAIMQDDIFICSVRDNGIGIDQAALPKIFDMFAQEKNALERSAGGLGIGLALVRGVTLLHGGTVTAQSAGIGRGSEFIVRIPHALARIGHASTLQNTGHATALKSALKVLIADDNADARESLALLLQLRGHEVTGASDGKSALTLAAEQRPDAIVLDIGMPEMNGYDVAQRLRNQTWGKRIILVAVTGWGQEEDRHRAIAAGFDHHLTKPLDPDVLYALLEG